MVSTIFSYSCIDSTNTLGSAGTSIAVSKKGSAAANTPAPDGCCLIF